MLTRYARWIGMGLSLLVAFGGVSALLGSASQTNRSDLAQISFSISPSVTPLPTATSTPTAAPTRQIKPTATIAPTRTPAAEMLVGPQASFSTTTLAPAEAYVGILPVEWIVRGSALDRVQTARFVRDRGAPIPLEISRSAADRITLRLSALPEPFDGTINVVLQLNGSTQELDPITLRAAGDTRLVIGVLPSYRYTRRVMTDDLGPYTTLHETTDARSRALASLRNGETVEVLRQDVEGWYEARILVSNDPAQVGRIGWIERWLIDDQDQPPAPTVVPTAVPRAKTSSAAAGNARSAPTVVPTARPQPRATARPAAPPAPRSRMFAAEVARSFPGSGVSGSYQSCVQGRVLDRGGSGVAAAVVNVNNGAAELGVQTNGAGEFRICSLGDSTWSAVLRYVPGSPGLAREVAGTVYVNGSAYQEAIVNFREQ